jgi:predicted RNA-binding Zn ribbon-like protein
MSEANRNAGSLDLLGGRLCLDFVNTVDWRGRAKPREFLESYPDLLSWAQHVGILSRSEAKVLLRKAAKRPKETRTVVEKAWNLREVLYRIFLACTEGAAASINDLSIFNEVLSQTMAQSRIVESEDGFLWDTDGRHDELDWFLSPIVRSAADLLVSAEIRRVKSCADMECGWLFLDVSRNRSRKWCDMSDCGNRAKASRFYKKRRSVKNDKPLSSS